MRSMREGQRDLLSYIRNDAMIAVIENGNPNGIATMTILEALARGIKPKDISSSVKAGVNHGDEIILAHPWLGQSL